jgi:hypothetical protein
VVDAKRWGLVLTVLGFVMLVGGYFIYLLTDRSFGALWFFGFVLGIAGATIRQRAQGQPRPTPPRPDSPAAA